MIVLDASALLAFLLKEPGSDRVEEGLADSCMSTVNLAEVLSKVERDGWDQRDVAALVAGLERSSIEWMAFGVEEARQAALLVPVTRHLGLSLGDRACLALARSRGLPAMTADRAWLKVNVGVEVEVVR